MILLEFLFFIQHNKVSAGISIYNYKFTGYFIFFLCVKIL